jgi:hypothetical protein
LHGRLAGDRYCPVRVGVREKNTEEDEEIKDDTCTAS